MPRIRITEKGWAGFTGNMGTAVFVNGEAEVSELEAMRFGASIQITRIDNKGEAIEQISPSLEIVRTKQIRAEVVDALPTSDMLLITPHDGEETITAGLAALAEQMALSGGEEVVTDPNPAGDGTEDNTTSTTVKIYSREELEKIADDKGIKGIREISDPLGLKSTSIVPLIDMILEHQAK